MLDGDSLRGRTFRSGDSADLAAVIDAYVTQPVADRQRSIAAFVERLAPEHVVAPFVSALRQRHPVPEGLTAAPRGRG
jgi:hypothetical protein